MTRTPDGKIITSQRTICFLTHSDIGGFSRDKTFAEKENGEDITLTVIKKAIAFDLNVITLINIKKAISSGPDLYSSVASSPNHYYSANISSACEPPQHQRQPSTKKTKQVKNEVIDTVESSV